MAFNEIPPPPPTPTPIHLMGVHEVLSVCYCVQCIKELKISRTGKMVFCCTKLCEILYDFSNPSNVLEIIRKSSFQKVRFVF